MPDAVFRNPVVNDTELELEYLQPCCVFWQYGQQISIAAQKHPRLTRRILGNLES